MTTQRTRFACWVSKPIRARAHTHTHTQKYVILIAVLWKLWFRKRVSMLRYTYIVCIILE